MNVLVTGASGFLGRHLSQHLFEAGNTVHTIVRPTTSLSRLPSHFKEKRIHVHSGGNQQLQNIVSLIAPKVVFHCAGKVLTDHTLDDVDSLVSSNVLFPTQLLEALSTIPQVVFVNVGSYLEYDEHGNSKALSLYTASKRAFQELCNYYARQREIKIITVILPVLYGAIDRRKRLMSLLKDAVKNGNELDLSPGHQRIDFLHIEDAIEALMLAHTFPTKSDEKIFTFFATSGTQVTLRELVTLVQKVTNTQLLVNWGAKAYKKSEIMNPCKGHSVRLPDWEPQISLESGIRKFMEL